MNSSEMNEVTPELEVPTQDQTEASTDIEITEIKDSIMPLETRKDFDNKAFELEDLNLGSSPKDEKNYFNRQERPGTMMSMTSITSKTSRSSINCASGSVRCPNLRLKKFYSYNKENGGFYKAGQDTKSVILPEKDGEFVGSWLLTEVNHWDLHRERIVMLTDKTLFIITYNFISMKVLDYRRLDLGSLAGVSVGDLKYPSSSIMDPYKYGGVRLTWPETTNLAQRLNPFSNTLPELVLTSHHILYNDKEKETESYNCDEFIASLEIVLSKLEENGEKKFEIQEGPIEIKSYASFISVLYNQNWLGFNLDRNGVNY